MGEKKRRRRAREIIVFVMVVVMVIATVSVVVVVVVVMVLMVSHTLCLFIRYLLLGWLCSLSAPAALLNLLPLLPPSLLPSLPSSSFLPRLITALSSPFLLLLLLLLLVVKRAELGQQPQKLGAGVEALGHTHVHHADLLQRGKGGTGRVEKMREGGREGGREGT